MPRLSVALLLSTRITSGCRGVAEMEVVRKERPERRRMHFYAGSWLFDRQTKQELREALDQRKEELCDLKVKLKTGIKES